MSQFDGRICLVTGAARGIGRNIATRLADFGATVVIIDMNRDQGEATAQSIRDRKCGQAFHHTADIGRLGAPEQMIRELSQQFGGIDILVNNARGGTRTQPLEETEENWRQAFDVSLKAPFFASQALIRIARQDVRPRAIVNISSVVAESICGESAAYHLTKAAMENMTRYLAMYGGPYGVRVNAVRPGLVVQDEYRDRYDRWDNAAFRKTAEFCHPLNTVGRSDDIADAVVFLCSAQAAFITGQTLTVDGGLTLQDPYALVKRHEVICHETGA